MSFFTADQLVAHAVGDYIIQSDWMAENKRKDSVDGPTDEWIMVSKCEWENAYRSIDDILGDLREADAAIKEAGKP